MSPGLFFFSFFFFLFETLTGWLDEKKAVMEAMTCFRRAGTDVILTYYAKQCAKWMAEDKLL